MINRYNVSEIAEIWKDESKFKYYLKVELALLESLEQHQFIPNKTSLAYKNVQNNLNRILEIEQTTQHDVIAFCSSITEQVPVEHARFFHFGVTSSDIIDTAHALMLRDSLNIILRDIEKLKGTLIKVIDKTSDLLCIGRSHGIEAEPMIMAQKFLSYYAELERREIDYLMLIKQLTGQFSGAVGNYTILNPQVESTALAKLHLATEDVSSQVIPRDHYAKIVANGALISCLFERITTELRLLQHSDINEVKEGFSQGQKGSSTMPHKKNPISAENLAGLSRIIRSHFQPAAENCALWHERDISHSSAERMILPDHFGLISYCLKRTDKLLAGLVFDREKIEEKIQTSFHFFSSAILHKLILLNPNLSRDQLYVAVQTSFLQASTLLELKSLLIERLVESKHNIDEWLNYNQLKSHYQMQFQLVRARVFTKI